MSEFQSPQHGGNSNDEVGRIPRDSLELQRELFENEPIRWRLPLVLFLLTVASTFYIGTLAYVRAPFPSQRVVDAFHSHRIFTAIYEVVRWLSHGYIYAVPLLSILLCHEFGHYVMARRHKVPASLPMFLPVPIPPFGTLGAVIRMRGRIRTKNALLDIGAAGPLAGLIVAIPVTYVGLKLSPVQAIERNVVYTQEGTSLLYAALKLLTKGSIPEGHDVMLHPVAMAGWVGLFVTMINLIPYGQLDGGHVAYALLGKIHDRWSKHLVGVLLALGVGTGVYWGRVLARQHRDPWTLGTGYTQGLNWFVFAFLIWMLHRGTEGKHPPTDPGKLTAVRAGIAVITLLMFVVLFMPVPLRIEVMPP